MTQIHQRILFKNLGRSSVPCRFHTSTCVVPVVSVSCKQQVRQSVYVYARPSPANCLINAHMLAGTHERQVCARADGIMQDKVAPSQINNAKL